MNRDGKWKVCGRIYETGNIAVAIFGKYNHLVWQGLCQVLGIYSEKLQFLTSRPKKGYKCVGEQATPLTF